MPTYKVPSHPGVLIVDPEVLVVCTLDRPPQQQFQPSIEFVCENLRIHHDLPSQAYVNGTWTDEDVRAAVAAHLVTLEE
jgi:hypothetical protein